MPWILLPVALLLGASPALTTFSLEAESYADSLNLGGEGIHRVVCSSASGGYAVQGVDAAGEWISFPFAIPEPVVLRDSLRSAGNIGVVRTHVVEFRRADTGALVLADTLVTLPGAGIG